MTEIDNFDQRKKTVIVDWKASMRHVNTNINLAGVELFGNPQTKDGGLQRSIEIYMNRPDMVFPPMNRVLPDYLKASRNIVTSYQMMKNLFEGTQTEPGYIQQLITLCDEMVAFMRESKDMGDEARETLKLKEEEIKEKEKQLLDLKDRIDRLGDGEVDELKYVDFLVGQYCLTNKKDLPDVVKTYYSGDANRRSFVLSMCNQRLKPYMDIYFKNLKDGYNKKGLDVEKDGKLINQDSSEGDDAIQN